MGIAWDRRREDAKTYQSESRAQGEWPLQVVERPQCRREHFGDLLEGFLLEHLTRSRPINAVQCLQQWVAGNFPCFPRAAKTMVEWKENTQANILPG